MHPFLPARDPARDPARLARAAPRGRHSKGARDGGAPHAAVGPGLTGTSPPAGKLHTRPGHVRECAVAVGDPELGLAVPFPRFLSKTRNQDFIDPPKNDKFLDGPTSGYCVEDY